MVERENHGFQVDLVYENLPSKCSYCGNLGHEVSKCKQIKKQDDDGEKATRGRSKSRKPRMEYRPKEGVKHDNVEITPEVTNREEIDQVEKDGTRDLDAATSNGIHSEIEVADNVLPKSPIGLL